MPDGMAYCLVSAAHVNPDRRPCQSLEEDTPTARRRLLSIGLLLAVLALALGMQASLTNAKMPEFLEFATCSACPRPSSERKIRSLQDATPETRPRGSLHGC
jgi:hypothetical protein